MKQRTQEPANCDLNLLHETFDCVIKSLWVDPNSREADSPFGLNSKLNAPSSVPFPQDTTEINAHLKELRYIVGFLHEKLNERAEAVKFEWEESLAFASAAASSEKSKITSPPVKRISTNNLAYLAGSPVSRSTPMLDQMGSDTSSRSSIGSPVQIFDEMVHSTAKNGHWGSSASSASSLSGSNHSELLHSNAGQSKDPHQYAYNTSSWSTSTPNGRRMSTISSFSPEQYRRRSLIPRATVSRNSYYSSPPSHTLPVLPSSKPATTVRSQTPGYLSSTASSRAYARPSQADNTISPNRSIQRPNSVASVSLRHRASMPSIGKRPLSQQQHIQPMPQQYPARSASSLYSVQEDIQHNRRSTSSIMRRMSSTSMLHDSSHMSHMKLGQYSTGKNANGASVHTCNCHHCVENQYMDDFESSEISQVQHTAMGPPHSVNVMSSPQYRTKSPVNQMYNRQIYISPLRRQSQLKTYDRSQSRISFSALRAVSDPPRSASVCYSYNDSF